MADKHMKRCLGTGHGSSVIPSIQGAERGRIEVWGKLMQKVSETPISTKYPRVMTHSSHASYVGGISK
jgi:hypothetical protein